MVSRLLLDIAKCYSQPLINTMNKKSDPRVEFVRGERILLETIVNDNEHIS